MMACAHVFGAACVVAAAVLACCAAADDSAETVDDEALKISQEGSETNVIGLPMDQTLELLARVGIAPTGGPRT